MHQRTSDFIAESAPLIVAFNEWVSREHPEALVDHLCWKCGSTEEFQQIRSLFEADSRYIYQSIIAGRPIAIIGLTQSIPTSLGEIRLLELSDQKPDGSQKSGFEHIEIYPREMTLQELADGLIVCGTAFRKIERPHHVTFDAPLPGGFLLRLEDEPLLEKIKREELR